jgi:hypothetical protein
MRVERVYILRTGNRLDSLISHEYPTEVPPPGILEAVSFNVTVLTIEKNEETPHDSALSQPVTSNNLKDPDRLPTKSGIRVLIPGQAMPQCVITENCFVAEIYAFFAILAGQGWRPPGLGLVNCRSALAPA